MPQFKTFKGRARELALLDELWQAPDAAQKYANELTKTTPKGKNWRSAGIKLLDLSRIDADLHRWARRV